MRKCLTVYEAQHSQALAYLSTTHYLCLGIPVFQALLDVVTACVLRQLFFARVYNPSCFLICFTNISSISL
jgi:hypothetical protein